MRSSVLFDWICKYQPDAHCEFAHGWWNSAEFWQLLSSDFESLDFGVIASFSMTTPPPASIITMPVVSARSPKLEIFFKESWVVEPNYTVTVKRQLPDPIILLDILQPIDQENKWLLQDFPGAYLYEPYREGAPAFSGCVKNQHLLYGLFHILSLQAGE